MAPPAWRRPLWPWGSRRREGSRASARRRGFKWAIVLGVPGTGGRTGAASPPSFRPREAASCEQLRRDQEAEKRGCQFQAQLSSPLCGRGRSHPVSRPLLPLLGCGLENSSGTGTPGTSCSEPPVPGASVWGQSFWGAVCRGHRKGVKGGEGRLGSGSVGTDTCGQHSWQQRGGLRGSW